MTRRGPSRPPFARRPFTPMAVPSQDQSRDANGEALEERVRRLEDAVAAIQDTQLMEDRVVERVVHRVEHFSAPSGPGFFAGAARMLLPRTVEPAGNGRPNGTADERRKSRVGGL